MLLLIGERDACWFFNYNGGQMVIRAGTCKNEKAMIMVVGRAT